MHNDKTEISLMPMVAANWCWAEASTQVSGASLRCDMSWKYMFFQSAWYVAWWRAFIKGSPVRFLAFLMRHQDYETWGNMKATGGSLSEKRKETRYVNCIIKKGGGAQKKNGRRNSTWQQEGKWKDKRRCWQPLPAPPVWYQTRPAAGSETH